MQKIDAPIIRWVGSGDTGAREWASTCGLCDCGLMHAPKPVGALPLFRDRCLQYEAGHLHFCTCRAGQTYRSYLVRKVREERDVDVRANEAIRRERALKGKLA